MRVNARAPPRRDAGATNRRRVYLWTALAGCLVAAAAASGQGLPGGPVASDSQRISIVLVRELRNARAPLSLLDAPPQDEGVAGARLAISDNSTTGRFLGREFALEVVQGDQPQELVAEVRKRVESGASFVVADVGAPIVLALASALKDQKALILNAGASDDRLREQDCRANVVHTAPTRTMLADGLAQYLALKQWRRWLLVPGTEPGDAAFAEALRRAAQRFGAKIVQERPFDVETGGRRADGGHEQIQQQIPVFTQSAPAYDVLVVADEGGLFGEYLPYRTWDPRPVAGTQGLVPLSWHPALEQWGATQFQNRFRRLANRPMRPLDYDVWVAVRSIGEAATRAKSAEASDLIAHQKSPEFELAAFKGRKLTYRPWNGQLRQPILLATANLPVSVSPQPGFLHQFSELDTLGIDRPETGCKAYAP